jgi:uncharacterized Fe-S cluster-containing radical SAM superfamily enzyme
MENNTIFVRSASDYTVVVNVPHIPLQRVWQKKGAKYPFDRNTMIQAYYDPSVEALFKEGKLVTDDEKFLVEVGLKEEGEPSPVVELTDTLKTRLIKAMPVVEVENELKKLTRSQIEELVDYAILHYQDLAMDRVDLFTRVSGKNVMEAIRNYKLSQEG